MTDWTFSNLPLGRAASVITLPLVAILAVGCGTKANNDTFDLSITPASTGPAARSRQILVPEPTALKAIDSNQVVVRVSPSEIQYLANSQWSDTVPRMVQSKLVAAFENSGRLGGVGKPGQGLAIDYQVVAEIRTFEVNTVGADAANVEIFVKILNDRDGTVRAQRAFQTSVPVSGSENRDFIQALNAAFAAAGAEIVEWSLQVM
ncbi:cholesterol transport system auxiliary component [Pseudorhizobium tarimense]|uniref:Cholesterol transport system auxiliary component n=1 Tax=Pseudorhizobium tarimense TaxID=1079109 RepID=A0ABV2H2R7_9HYPH|nr:ABC-type transport auxiliary lipoprotein family protein [Pseudorhizobium tarimense]MCJ8518163.1 ABC-type transport auxiliary lipoprotein family protein [Pseudorhizobium tarimense]